MANFNRTISCLQAVKEAMGEIGLPEPTSVVGNPEKTVNSMFRILNRFGKWLSQEYDWQILAREQVINTVGGTLEYALPEDFNGYVSDTMWNHTTRLPAIGPVPDPVWQQLQARLLSGMTFTMLYRIERNKVVFDAVPSAPDSNEIRVSYNSRAWVQSADSLNTRDECQANDDVILFEPNVIVSGLKWKWREARGFDTVAAKKEAMDAINAALARDVPGVRLSTVPVNVFPYLGVQNIPDSGYGH